MKNKKKIFVFVLSVIAIILNYRISYAFKNVDFFQEMINTSNGKIMENGLRTRFKSSINGQELIRYFIDKINTDQGTNIRSYENKGNYYIDFEKENITGVISIKGLKDEKVVVIDIFKRSSNNELDEIKNEIELIINPILEGEKEFYEYLKAKLPDESLVSINDKLISLIKNNGAKNISSVELNNGFSTCAYTSMYKPKSNNGELMDLNFALSNYSSGKYLIIGTPEIITSY